MPDRTGQPTDRRPPGIDLRQADQIAGRQLPEAYHPPAGWTPEHVDYRLTEAYDTLLRLPLGAPRPKAFGNAMPSYAYSLEDIEAQMESGEFLRARKRAVRKRSVASPEEVTRMEDALGWSMRYLRNEFALAKAVSWSSFRKAVKKGEGNLALELGVSRRTLFRYRLTGLQRIADGLKRDGVVCS